MEVRVKGSRILVCVCLKSAYISDANSRVPPGLRVLIIGHSFVSRIDRNLLRSYFPSYWMIEELGKPGFPTYLMIVLESIGKTWWESKTQKNCCGMFTLLLPILFMYTLGQMILVLIQGHLGWLFLLMVCTCNKMAN